MQTKVALLVVAPVVRVDNVAAPVVLVVPIVALVAAMLRALLLLVRLMMPSVANGKKKSFKSVV